jgi:alkylhydroperoxidase family enzyme
MVHGMSMRLTDGQLRTFAVRADYPLQDAAAELLALRERVAKLEAALNDIVSIGALQECGCADCSASLAAARRLMAPQ